MFLPTPPIAAVAVVVVGPTVVGVVAAADAVVTVVVGGITYIVSRSTGFDGSVDSREESAITMGLLVLAFVLCNRRLM